MSQSMSALLRRALFRSRPKADRPRAADRLVRPRLFEYEDIAAPNSLTDLASVAVLGGMYGTDYPVARVDLPDLAAPPPAAPAEARQDPAEPPTVPATPEPNEGQPPTDLRLEDPLAAAAAWLSLDDDFVADGQPANPFVGPIAPVAGPPSAAGGAASGSGRPASIKSGGEASATPGDPRTFPPPDSSAAFDTAVRGPASDLVAARPAAPAAIPADTAAPTDPDSTAPTPTFPPAPSPTGPEPAPDRAVVRPATGGDLVSLDAHGHRLEAVEARSTPPDTGGIDLPLGLFAFNVTDVMTGGIAAVDLQLPAGSAFNTYYKQDPATGDLARFDWDGTTGAVFHGRTVTLYLQDGGRGDADGVANGVIVDPGGPGGPGGGGAPGGTGPLSEDFWIENDWGWSYVGEAVDFSLETWLDPVPNVTLVEWDFAYDFSGFQAEASGTSWSATHTFNQPGEPVVAARFSEPGGEPSIVTAPFEVYRVPPEVSFAGDLTATAGTPVTITATVESEGDITEWDWWKLPDGEEWVQLPSNPSSSLSYTFDEAGEYEIWLGVTDEYGEEGSASVFVTVEAAEPTMVATGPAAINEGEYATFDIAVTDPERFEDPAVYADWEGTGDWELLDEAEFELYEPENGQYRIPHRYDNDAGYTAKFWVGDDWGTTDEAETTIQVSDVRIEARIRTDSLAPALRPFNENDDYGMVTTGMGEPVVPGPKAVYGLPRIGVTEGIGMEIYIISPGTNLTLWGDDPSFADQEGLSAVWTPGPGTTVNGNVLTVAANAPRGVLIPVKAKVLDARGVPSVEKTFFLTVEESYPWPSSPLFAQLEALGGWGYQTPNPYDPFGEYESQDDPVAANELKVRLRLTPESQAWVDRVGGSVRYTYMTVTYPGNNDPEFHTFSAAQNNAADFAFAYGQAIEPGQSVLVDAYATVSLTVNGQPTDVMRSVWYNQIGLTVIPPPEPEDPDPSLLEQLTALANLAQSLPYHFGNLVDNLVGALTGDHKWDAINGLATGLSDGFAAYVEQLRSNPVVPLVRWLLGGQGTVQIATLDDVPAAILQHLGLDEEAIRARIINILGEGNLEALDTVAKVFDFLDDPNNPVDLNDPKKMWDFLTRSEETGGMGLNVGEILGQITSRMGEEVVAEIPRILVQLAVKFAPGFGVLKTIVSTGQWLLNNSQELQTGLQPLFSLTKEDFEQESGAAVKAAVLAALPGITTLALDFIARQFGLDRIKRLFREKIKDLPGQIEEKIRAFVRSKLPANRVAPGAAESPYVGQVGQRYAFTYKTKSYQLIVARQSRGLDQGTYVVRVIQNGKMIVELDQKQIETNPVFPNALEKAEMLTKFHGVVGAAGALEAGLNGSRKQAQLKRTARRQGKSNVTPGQPATNKVELGKLADALRKAVGNTSPNATGLLKYLELYGCALLNAGCFAAGTKLWTPDGYRNVEEIRVGDFVFSRDEHRPDGSVEARPVEQVFVRLTEVVHVHVGGQVIRTTQEHPFYARNRGWVPVERLSAGEHVLTAAGDWKRVEDVFYTGEIESVYNLRVADHHTYFVGDDGWGWAAWAHNAYITLYRYPVTNMPDQTKHWSIRVTVDDPEKKTNHTHLVLDDFPNDPSSLTEWLAWHDDARIERAGSGGSAEASKTLTVADDLALAAYNYAETRVTSGDFKYDLCGRSCFTYVAQVLNRAGYNLAIPAKGDVAGMNALLSALNNLLS